MSHLGPDGECDYTHSIAECMTAVLADERVRDPAVRAVIVEWDAQGHMARLPITWDTSIEHVDQFADTTPHYCQTWRMPLSHVLNSLRAYA